VQANISVPLWRDRIFLGLDAQAVSERATVKDTTVPSYFLLNSTLFTRELLPGLEASVSVYNLLDDRYRDPAGEDLIQDSIEQHGRTFRVKLTYRF
jgi:iron complex outermembrane receptor protein